MSSHAKAAGKFIADSERTARHDRALYFRAREARPHGTCRARMGSLAGNGPAAPRCTPSPTWPTTLKSFERHATANGVHVHWAKDAEEHNRIVYDIIRRHGGTRLVKSKSMLAEECGLSPYLEARGIEAVESDLERTHHAAPQDAAQPHCAAGHTRQAGRGGPPFLKRKWAPSTATATPLT